MKIRISVIIPTKNEERNIRKCLESVAWADQVYVVDSHSTDATVEIAESMGAQVVQFSWDGVGPRKKTWALSNLEWKHEWILIVDADEEVTDALRDEIADMLQNPPPQCTGFLIPYYYYFLGKCLRHGAPLWKLILFRAGTVRFERMDVPEVTAYDVELHEHPLITGAIRKLRSPMIHHDFDDLHHYFDRHNTYSDWEALLRSRYRERDRSSEIRARVLGSAMERRRFAKRLFMSIPGKSFLYFVYSYVFRGGFLDGRAGFIYNVLKSFYWYQIAIKEYEIRRRGKWLAQPSEQSLSGRVGVPAAAHASALENGNEAAAVDSRELKAL